MSIRTVLLAAAAATLVATALPAAANSLRYANQGDLKSLDPYTLNETTTNAHLGHDARRAMHVEPEFRVLVEVAAPGRDLVGQIGDTIDDGHEGDLS